MSLLDQLTDTSSHDEVVKALVEELKARKYTYEEAIGVVADGEQESGFRLVWDPSRRWFGDYQQDASYPNRFTHAGNIRGFLDRLDVNRRSPGHGDIWLNIFWLQQRPSEASAADAWNDPDARRDYLKEIQSKRNVAQKLVDRFWGGDVSTPVVIPATNPGGTVTLADPRTFTRITSNRYAPRGLPSPKWIACHTSESMSRVLDLMKFCERAGVSYNTLVDDRDIGVAVERGDAPWAAMNANKYALHVCWSSSFAGWSRGQWLDEAAANDGIDERKALRNGALQIAYWVQESRREGRPIPVEWIGGNGIPWGRDGICGHQDFGAWGGGHHDPGWPNFPADVLLADVRALLDGTAGSTPPVVQLPPVVLPDTDPGTYAGWLEYQGKPNPNVDHVMRIQTRLKRAYASYGGALVVDGDFGLMTKTAVMEFQRRSHLIVDGIVGPATAAALKP